MAPINIDGSPVQDITIDGQPVTEVTVDGDVVFPAIPDSVEYQYVAGNFASPWADEVGGADMTVNGISASTFSNGEESVAGDGSNDFGIADGPESIGSNQSFTLAFTNQFSSVSSLESAFGAFDGAAELNVRTNNDTANFQLQLSDSNANILRVSSDNTFGDGTPHAVVFTKTGDTASDISLYVDDMANEEPLIIEVDDAFDHTNFNLTTNMAFFARNNQGSIGLYGNRDCGVFEFASAAYTQTQRENFVSRRPEV